VNANKPQVQGLYFSIFFCGCKQPKSVHMLKSAAKLLLIFELQRNKIGFFCFCTKLSI